MFIQTRRQVLRFGTEKHIFTGQDFSFDYMYMTNLSGHKKILGAQIGGVLPRMFCPVATSLWPIMTYVRALRGSKYNRTNLLKANRETVIAHHS